MNALIIPKPTLAIAAGAVIIAVATNAIVQQTGGIWTSHALLVIGLAFGVFTGSYVLPSAWRDTKTIAVVIVLSLVAGELYNFATTAERIVIAREEAQTPLRDLSAKRDALSAVVTALAATKPSSERLVLAKQRLADVSAETTDSPRVRVARDNAAATQAAVDAEASNIRCVTECQRKQGVADKAAVTLRLALDADAAERAGNVAKAEAEVAAALREAVDQHAAKSAAAKAALDAVPLPASATPLADRTGFAPWALDLILAGLLSLGANGLAAALIAYGSSALLARPDPALSDETLVEIRQRFFSSDSNVGRSVDRTDGGASNGGSDRGPGRRPDRKPDRPLLPGPSGGLSLGLTKSEALADLMDRLADGRTIPSQDALASDWNRPKQTVSDWMREWRRIGVVPAATPAGRCKATVPA